MTGRVCGSSGAAFWTEARVARLKELAEEGLSFTAIAADIGAESRNAVAGKLHRLGIKKKCLGQPCRRTSPTPKAQRNGGAALFSIRARAAAKSRKNTAPKQSVDFDELPSNEATSLPAEMAGNNTVAFKGLRDNHCRYPIDVSGGVMFCGDDVSRGSYCGRHARICFVDRAT